MAKQALGFPVPDRPLSELTDNELSALHRRSLREISRIEDHIDAERKLKEEVTHYWSQVKAELDRRFPDLTVCDFAERTKA